MAIQRFSTTGRLSKALKADGKVYLSGLTSRNKAADVTAQTADILKQIDGYLAEVGTDKTRLVKVNIWLADIAEFDAMNAAWDAWVSPDHLPARATVEARLAA